MKDLRPSRIMAILGLALCLAGCVAAPTANFGRFDARDVPPVDSSFYGVALSD